MERRTTYILSTKPVHQGERGERIHKCKASSLTEAIQMFATMKQLRPDQLIKLFRVYEQPTDGK